MVQKCPEMWKLFSISIFFYESFVQEKFNELVGREIIFVQDNCSCSRLGVLRGMHYQEPPYAQGKLVSVIHGEIYDVALDIRKESASYGKWTSEYLSGKNKKQMWIPEGFAHGYLALTDDVFINSGFLLLSITSDMSVNASV